MGTPQTPAGGILHLSQSVSGASEVMKPADTASVFDFNPLAPTLGGRQRELGDTPKPLAKRASPLCAPHFLSFPRSLSSWKRGAGIQRRASPPARAPRTLSAKLTRRTADAKIQCAGFAGSQLPILSCHMGL